MTFFLNPLENIILQEEVWKADIDEEEEEIDVVHDVHIDQGIEYKLVNLTNEA